MGIKLSRLASVVGGLLMGLALTFASSADLSADNDKNDKNDKKDGKNDKNDKNDKKDGPPKKKDDDKKDGPPKNGRDDDGKNDLKGRARWDWQLFDEKGKPTQSGMFTGYQDGTLKHGKDQKQIGTAKNEDGKIKATITEGALKGVLTLKLVDRKPLKYNGELVRADGTKQKLVLEIVED